MADLNIALILKFVDRATRPAREALNQLDRVGLAMQARVEGQFALSMAQIEKSRAALRALSGQAFALAASGYGMMRFMQPAVKFEEAMAKVGAVSRANAEELERMTAAARRLGAETPWSASQAAEGMQYLAMAGFSVEQIIAAMPGMLNLASAGAIDLGRAADIASNILTGFNMSADQTGRLGDVLTNAFTTSNTTLASLGDTMKYVAPLANALGVDLETAVAMAGKLGDAGIQGEMAGTALRAVLSAISAPPPEAMKVFDKLGVSAVDAAGNMRPVLDVLADLNAAMSGYGEAARADMIRTMFGVEAMTAATTLLGKAGSGDLQTYAAKLHEAGSAARVASQMTDNAAGRFKELGSRTEALSIALGTLLIPALIDLIDWIVPVIDQMTAWAQSHPEVVRGLAMVVAGLFAASAVMLMGSAALNVLLIGFWTFNIALSAVVWSIGGLLRGIAFMGMGLAWLSRIAIVAGTAALRGLGLAIRGIGRALLWAGRAALANPLLLVLTGIALTALAIYQNWDGFVAYFTDKIDRVRAAFDEGLLHGIFQTIAEFNPFRMIMDANVNFAIWINQQLEAAFGIDLFDAGVRMIESLRDGIWSILTDMVDAIRAKLASIVPDWMVEGLGIGPYAPRNLGAEHPSARDYPFSGHYAGPGTVGPGAMPPGRALGGPVRAGMLYRWMEEGPELFRPAVDGSVVSTRTLNSIWAGGGGSVRSISVGDIVINAVAGQSPTDIAAAVRRELERLLHDGSALHDGGAYAD